MQASLVALIALSALTVFGFVGFVLWLPESKARAKLRHREEVQKQLLGKFSSLQELTDFLSSDPGKLLLGGASGYPESPSKDVAPRPFKEQVGITISWGVLAICVGAAVFVVRGLTLPGAVFTALGIGFLINAMLRVLLHRKWHP
jgi:hypothetical protein